MTEVNNISSRLTVVKLDVNDWNKKKDLALTFRLSFVLFVSSIQKVVETPCFLHAEL